MIAEPKVAIVTGAAAGIGRACARRFAQAGLRVLMSDIDIETLERSRAAIAQLGGTVVSMRADVASERDCRAFAQHAVDTWGRIDVLVANAGVQTAGTLQAATEAEWNSILSVNLKGVAYSCRAVLETMLARTSGSIVMISSVNALVGTPGMAIYDASKAGVLALMRNLAVEYGPQGIRVNAVCPGATVTDYHERRARARGLSPRQLRDSVVGYGLLGRAAEPAEIASAVYFLASEEASFITGQSLAVDGGFTVTGGGR